jgi:hypothetical protein
MFTAFKNMPGHNTVADTETQDSSATHAIKKIVAKCNKNQRNVHKKHLITSQEQDLILM